MTRIVFSDDDDLLAVRFARSPAWETHLAVRTFVDERSRLFHLPWHRAVRAAAARLDLGPLLATNPPSGFVPDFLTPPPSHSAPTLAEQLGQIRATPLGQVKNELERCLASNGGGPYRTCSNPSSRILSPRASCWPREWRKPGTLSWRRSGHGSRS